MPQHALTSNSSISHLIENYRKFSHEGVPLVMATVIETMGSTYRKAGARMLITADGQFHGLIGGGCFEGDLFEQTRAVFESGTPRVVFYDMRAPEDAVWGLGLGCNGAVRILLQRLDIQGNDPTIHALEMIHSQHRQRTLATVCSGPAAGSSFLPGEEVDDTCSPYASADAQCLTKPALEHFPDETDVFFDVIPPRFHLLLIGAGADALPVCQLATQLDWRVTVVDYRPRNVVPARFPGAEAVLHVHPAELLDRFREQHVDAVVLMTHNIDYDAQYLMRLAELPCRYLGLLGPRIRADQLFERSGIDEASVFGERVRAPVGLDIGGRSPESIALSLIAEIHACLHDRDATTLSAGD